MQGICITLSTAIEVPPRSTEVPQVLGKVPTVKTQWFTVVRETTLAEKLEMVVSHRVW